MTTDTTPPDPRRDAAVREIAWQMLDVSTVYARGRDGLDFHDLHVDRLVAALKAAYDAGRAAATDDGRTT